MKKFQMIIFTIITSLLLILSVAFAEPEAAPAQGDQPAQTEEQPLTGSEAPAKQPIDVLELKINLDGSSVLSDTVFRDLKSLESFIPQVEKLGYTAEIVDQDGAKGLKISKSTLKTEPVLLSFPGEDAENSQILKIKKPFSDMYVFSTKRFDMRQYPVDDDLLMVKLNLPVKPYYSNATEQANGGKLITWKIRGGAVNAMDMILIVPNFVNIAILVLAILIIIFLIFIIISSNKKKKLMASNAELLDSISVDSENGETLSEVEDPFENMTAEEIETDITEEDLAKDTEIDVEIKDEK